MITPIRVFVFALCVVALMLGWFLYTTKTAQPTSMKLFLPKDEKNFKEGNLPSDQALHLVLLKDEVLYYEGNISDTTQARKTDLKGIGSIIIGFKEKRQGKDAVILINPMPVATYKNTVDILDQMSVHEIEKYALVDLTENEKKLLRL